MFYQNVKRINTILLVDNEQRIIDILALNLQKNGYKIYEATEQSKAIEILNKQKIDLVIFDENIISNQVRKEIKAQSVIVTAAISNDAQYITKPYKIQSLIQKVEDLLSKIEQKDNHILTMGNVVIDKEKVEVKVKGKLLNLSPLEYKVFEYIACQQGNSVDRKSLIKNVWCYEDYYEDTRIVDVTISRIREKIEEIDPTEQVLLTKRGLGYSVKMDI